MSTLRARAAGLFLCLILTACDGPAPPSDGGPQPDAPATDNAPPESRIDAPEPMATVRAGDALAFAGRCEDPDGDASRATHLWDFGGAAPASELEDPGSVILETPGIHVVSYRCVDELGLPDPTPATLALSVTEGGPVRAHIDSPSGEISVETGSELEFEGRCTDESDAGPLTHSWDFDGAADDIAVEDPGTLRLDVAGTFEISYTCTNGDAESDTASVTVRVAAPPESRIVTPEGDVTVAVGATIDFTGSCDATGAPSHEWDFGGAAPASTVASPGPVVMATEGRFVVRYRCASDGLWDAIPDERIVVVEPPQRWLPVEADTVGDGREELMLLDLTGASSPPLQPVVSSWPLHATPAYGATVSPDGRHLAFAADIEVDGARDLYLVDLSAPSPSATRITSLDGGRGVTGNMRWSPNSTKLAFTADITTYREFELWVVDISAGLSAATPYRAHGFLARGGRVEPLFEWTSDSTHLCFAAELGTVREAFAFDTTRPGASERRLHAPLSSPSAVLRVQAAGADACLFTARLGSWDSGFDAWAVDLRAPAPSPVRLNARPAGRSNEVSQLYPSPDGSRVVFLGDLDVAGGIELHYVDLRGGVPSRDGSSVELNRALSSDSQRVVEVDWAPTSDRVTFQFFDAVPDIYELYVADVAGASPSTLLVDTLPPRYEYARAPVWSQDGARLLYGRMRSSRSLESVVYADLTSSPIMPVTVTTPPAVWVSRSVWLSHTSLLLMGPDPSVVNHNYLIEADLISDSSTRLDRSPPPARTLSELEQLDDGSYVTTERPRDGDHVVVRVDRAGGRVTPLHTPVPMIEILRERF